MKLTETKKLLLFVALVLLIPALLSRPIPAKRNFDQRPLQRLHKSDPSLILIGDSMLDSRIDPRLLEERLGHERVTLLWNGGAASACWYLILKNYILASGVRPRCVYIFFRDRMLTDARFRTDGIYRPYFESLMLDEEKVCQLVLGKSLHWGSAGLERWVTAVYPLNARRSVQHDRISRMMFGVVAPTGHNARALKRRVNATFNVVKMRGELMAEASDVSDRADLRFDPDPRRNFLPHIVDAAEAAGLPLSFVRVKRHPAADGQVPETLQLQHYVADLAAWLASRHCEFIDFTNDPRFTPDMYLKAKDDHIGPWAKARSTEIFADRIRSSVKQ